MKTVRHQIQNFNRQSKLIKLSERENPNSNNNPKRLTYIYMHSNKHNSPSNDNVKVVVRVRPPLERQIREAGPGVFMSTVEVDQSRTRLQLYEYYNYQNLGPRDFEGYMDNPQNYSKHSFTFDKVYDEQATQEEIYTDTARISVCSALEGYNATIMAYGQTGTGKTFTMEGFKFNMRDEERGIIPRAVEDIFKYIQSCQDSDTTFMVRASYLQIYNEVINDLLRSDKTNLQIREDARKGIYVEGISEWAVVRPDEIMELIRIGAKSRATAKTNMNESSSRSHAVFIITIEQMRKCDNDEEGKELKVAKLNLVDLAGSQRVRVTGASGQRLDECKKINLSLSCLGMVISALTERKNPDFIPYRNSVLTRLISDSLGGNCKTTMMTMISPALQAFHESLSSLKFAFRAKSIKNKPTINQDVDQRALIRKYENQLKRLRTELDEKNKTIIDKTRLMQLEEEKKKMEEDKNNVMKALQQRSKEFFREREEKKKLEEKIKAFNSQLIHGGGNSSELEKAFAEQKKLIKQYQNKLKNMEEEKVRSGANYDLFEKQNEILMQLTAKINQRDEINLHLNEQLCAYDRITKETEELLERRNERIEMLESLLRKHKIAVPKEEYSEKTKNEEKEDGVIYDGKITYNITQANMRKVEEQIKELTEINVNHKEEIKRLKNQLSSYQNPAKPPLAQKNLQPVSNEGLMELVNQLEQTKSAHASLENILKQKDRQLEVLKYERKSALKPFKEGIDIITKGLMRKENTDLKMIISEIFKLQKMVNSSMDQ